MVFPSGSQSYSVRRTLARTIVITIALLGSISAASAQDRSRRPFRRIFGEVRERPGGTQQLDFSFSFLQAYDDNVLGEQLPQGDPRFQEGGTFPSASLDVRYTRRVRRMTMTAVGGTGLQYYPQLNGTLDRSHNAAIDLNFPVGDRTTARFGQTASFATFFTLLGLPGNVLPQDVSVPAATILASGPQFGVASEEGWEYHTAAGLSGRIGRRGSLEGSYGYARTDLPNTTSTSQETGLTYSHPMTRHANLALGYRYHSGGDASATDRVVLHDVNVGVNYRRNLPRARNTSIAFSTGSAIVARAGLRDYRLIADAQLTHLMGRSWTASLAYDRTVEFVAILSELVSSDAVIGGVSGFITTALEASVSGSYSRGTVGFLAPGGGRMVTYSGAARVQYALSRHIALDARYLSYFYEFGAGVVLPVELAPGLSRQGLRVGLTIWLPLIR